MHDYFDILGVARDAPAREIRLLCARHVRRSHPDFLNGGCPRAAGAPGIPALDRSTAAFSDAAVDFVELGPVIDRMQIAFFRSSP